MVHGCNKCIRKCDRKVINKVITVNFFIAFVSTIGFLALSGAKNYSQTPSNQIYCDKVIFNSTKDLGYINNDYCYDIFYNNFDINIIPQECQRLCKSYRGIEFSIIIFFIFLIGGVVLLLIFGTLHIITKPNNQPVIHSTDYSLLNT